jgi:spore coat protein U-like protein
MSHRKTERLTDHDDPLTPHRTNGTFLVGATTSILFALLLTPLPTLASCSFTSVTGASFGTYNVFSALSNTNGVGSLNVNCNGGGASSFVVTLSTGQSNSYAVRVMKNGGNSLNYNLYTSAARTVIWGDGSGGSSVMTASRNGTTALSIMGEIPAEQNVSVGSYTDSIITTVNF